jgi:5'-nucleotidase
MPAEPREPVLILTNDDGVDAPGLAALWQAAAGLGSRQIIAPIAPWSCRGHAVTTDGPIRVVHDEGGRMAVEGTPADCVRVGLFALAPEAGWVLAGINAGGNLGADVYHSGTVAAAREAVLHGRPAIAFSHYIARGRSLDWPKASRWAGRVLRELLGRPWQPGSLWNVNFPHLEPGASDPEVVECALDPSPLPLNFRTDGDAFCYNGDYQRRARRPGDDVDVCFGGRIAVTRIVLYPPDDAPVAAPRSGLAEGGLGSA